MKRAVVFAHYDKQNIVDDYVIYYLKALKEIASDIVFVSCNPIENKNALNGLVSKIIDEHHEEYDFGSYKRGYFYLRKNLDDYDELIFANDSCFGPFYPLSKIFEEMGKRDCDFWGISKNNFGYKKSVRRFIVWRPHVQSYFLVLKKNVIKSPVFDNFMNSIKHEDDKRIVVSNYEIGLSEILKENGFRYEVFVNAYGRINNITILKWRQIILKHKMPFIKCSLPRLVNKSSTTVEGYQDIIKQVSDYPVELIENNVLRTQEIKNGRHTSPIFIKRLFFDILAEMPFFVRKFAALFISKFLPFIRD